MLTVDGSRVYALVPTQPQTLVVTDRALHVKARFALPRGPLSPPCASVSTGPFLGCSPEVHGAIAAYDEGWIATSGSAEDLLVLDARGNVVRRIDSGFRNEHQMSLIVDQASGIAYSL